MIVYIIYLAHSSTVYKIQCYQFYTETDDKKDGK